MTFCKGAPLNRVLGIKLSLTGQWHFFLPVKLSLTSQWQFYSQHFVEWGTFTKCLWPVNDSFKAISKSVIDWSMTVCFPNPLLWGTFTICHWLVNEILFMDIPLWELMDKCHWLLSQWHISKNHVSKSVIVWGQWHFLKPCPWIWKKKVSLTASELSYKYEGFNM